MIDETEPAEYMFIWLLSDIVHSMPNLNKILAENLPWIQFQINSFKIIIWKNGRIVSRVHCYTHSKFHVDWNRVSY